MKSSSYRYAEFLRLSSSLCRHIKFALLPLILGQPKEQETFNDSIKLLTSAILMNKSVPRADRRQMDASDFFGRFDLGSGFNCLLWP